MPNFKPDNINQRTLLDVDFLEILGDNTFEYSLYRLLNREGMMKAFEDTYTNHDVGRRAYPPALLLRLILYAYYRGVISSRVIASLCKTDLKFMALAGGETPHFTTIADFVSAHPEAIIDVFQKVLLICDQSGLIGRKHFAIDGCKLRSDASKQWSGKHSELKRKSNRMKKMAKAIIAKHREGDSMKSARDENALQSIDTLMDNARKIDEFLSDNEPRIGAGKKKAEVQSNITDNESAKLSSPGRGSFQGYTMVTAADEKHQVIIGVQGYGLGQEHSTLKPMIESIEENLSMDLSESQAVVTADTGFASEENNKYLFDKRVDAIVPDRLFRKRKEQFEKSRTYQRHKANRQKTRPDRPQHSEQIKSSDFKVDIEKRQCLCPAGKGMMYHGKRELTRGTYSIFRGRLKDRRACKKQRQCMQRPIGKKGRQVIFLNEQQSRKSYTDLMKQKIDSDEGAKQYSKRMWTIEPVFANITSNKRLGRSSLRGRDKVNGQWTLYCMIHNMEKLWRYGDTQAAA